MDHFFDPSSVALLTVDTMAVLSTLSSSVSQPKGLSSKQQDHNMALFFRFLDGKTMCLALDPDSDIYSVKQQLLEQYRRQQKSIVTAPDQEKTLALTTTTSTTTVMMMLTMMMLRPHNLSLCWNGKPLDDDCLLSDYYGLTTTRKTASYNPTTIIVSYRNNGGCFMVSLSILTVICAAVIGSPCTCGVSLFVVPFLLPLLFILPLFCL